MFYPEKSQAAVVKGVLEIRIFPAKLPCRRVTPTALELQEMELHSLTNHLAKIQQVSHVAVGNKVLAVVMNAERARRRCPLHTTAWQPTSDGMSRQRGVRQKWSSVEVLDCH